tara:strand:+ start:574 stop:732 length:159 start_codon:yes stop_codon:yes gene_type:complete
MRRYFLLILLLFAFIGCGTTGPLWLPEGVEDKAKFKYPPALEEECNPSEKEC